jgi:membrane fusion protein (multidrug efflux system)
MTTQENAQHETSSAEKIHDVDRQNPQTQQPEPHNKDKELSPEEQRKTEKRKRALLIFGVVALVALVVWGTYHLIWAAGHQETDDAYVTGHLHPISARVAGTVDGVLVDDNQHVQQGQLIVTLDPKDLEARVDQAKAALDAAYKQAETAQAAVSNSAQNATAENLHARGTIGEAKASIAAQKAAVIEAQANIASAQAKLAQATANLHKDETDLHRYEDLAAKEQVSRQSLDHARTTYEVSAATQAAAKQAVEEAQAKLLRTNSEVARTEAILTSSFAVMEQAKAAGLETDVRSGEYGKAKAAVDQAKAALEEARLQLSYTKLVAPVSGKIGRKSVEAGQRLQIGQPVMAVIEDTPWVVANFKETQLNKMRPNQEVEVTIDTFPKHLFKGHVDSVAPGSGNEFALLPPDNATGNFTKIVQRIPVKIVLDKDSMNGYQDFIVPGMSATVTVTTK